MKDQHFIMDTTEASNHKTFAGGQFINDTRDRCSNCGMFLRDSYPNHLEIELNYLGREGFVEYLWNSHSLPIFREDLVERWKSASNCDFDIRPVTITGWHQNKNKPIPENIPSYYLVFPIKFVRLSIPPPETSPCIICGSIKYDFPKIGTHLPNGIKIDIHTWEGYDYFGVLAYNYVFCSKSFAKATLSAGYNRYLAFISVENYHKWKSFNIKEGTTIEYKKYVDSYLIRDPNEL